MTLNEFADICFTTPGRHDAYTIVVFDDEGSADSWLDDHLEDGDNNDAIIFCVLHGDTRTVHYLKDEVGNREVEMVFAVNRDLIAVVIGKEKE